MTLVHITTHLYAFFPLLEGRTIEFDAATARDVVAQLDALAPGIGLYICDELGCLRRHVNFFIDKRMIRDRRTLSDPVAGASEVHILQALSGG